MKFYYCVEREIKPDTFSSLIMRVTKANYSHAFILVKDVPLIQRVKYQLPLGGDLVFHATVPKYSVTTLERELSNKSVIEDMVEIDVWSECEALAWLVGNLGKEYSLEQCLGLLFPLIKDAYRNDDGKGICSEFAVRFGGFHCVDTSYFSDVDYDFITPEAGLNLYKSLRK